VVATVDWWLLFLRIVHIGSAMIWFGGAIIGGFFLSPTAAALGDSAQPFMDHLMRRRRMGIVFPIAGALTVLAGAALYWRDSGGLQAAWITSPTGLAFTIGGAAAIVSFALGFVLVAPSIGAQTAVRNELAASGGAPSADQLARLEHADRLMRLATRVDLPLILLAGLTMATARYL
jgi:uncharacterized membrane protein